PQFRFGAVPNVLEVAIRLSSLEEAIDDFIEGAIAAHGHDQRARLANRPARDLGGVTWTRCEDGVEVEAWGPRQFSDRWPAAANPARGCGGVDDQDRFRLLLPAARRACIQVCFEIDALQRPISATCLPSPRPSRDRNTRHGSRGVESAPDGHAKEAVREWPSDVTPATGTRLNWAGRRRVIELGVLTTWNFW